MTANTMNGWILSISILVGLTMILYASSKPKSARWNIFGVFIILGGMTLVTNRREDAFKEEQKTVIREELESRFALSGLWVEVLEQESKESGYRYGIVSEDGTYQATFHPRQTTGFELTENSGESLRSRRNAFDAIQSLPEDSLPSEWMLEYQTNDLYTLLGDEGNWTINLNESIVTTIVDDEGRVRYQHETTISEKEGEGTHE